MPSYFEAYGLVFVEALIFGLPCIGRNCYEMPYFIQDGNSPEHVNDATGLLLDEDNPQELASLMLRLLNEDSFTRNVISRRQQYIHDFSWDTVAERIAQVIG
jgi:glycosyltransferase involved in cell wall biosynthesis